MLGRKPGNCGPPSFEEFAIPKAMPSDIGFPSYIQAETSVICLFYGCSQLGRTKVQRQLISKLSTCPVRMIPPTPPHLRILSNKWGSTKNHIIRLRSPLRWFLAVFLRLRCCLPFSRPLYPSCPRLQAPPLLRNDTRYHSGPIRTVAQIYN